MVVMFSPIHDKHIFNPKKIRLQAPRSVLTYNIVDLIMVDATLRIKI
jgi:hypothetical protein